MRVPYIEVRSGAKLNLSEDSHLRLHYYDTERLICSRNASASGSCNQLQNCTQVSIRTSSNSQHLHKACLSIVRGMDHSWEHSRGHNYMDIPFGQPAGILQLPARLPASRQSGCLFSSAACEQAVCPALQPASRQSGSQLSSAAC